MNGVIRANRLHEQLAAHLAREIIAGRLRPGMPIPSEPELVAEFGVSKTVARETVQALASVGLVRVQHGKRTVVLTDDEWQLLSHLVQEAYREEGQDGGLIDELYEVRLLLEPPAARWAAERATKELVNEIVAIVDEMEAAILVRNGRFLDLDREFHLAIVGPASANRVLRAIVRDIHELLVTSWARSHLAEEEIVEAFRQHRRVAGAIASGDGAGAEETMRVHLEWAARTDREPDDRGRTRSGVRRSRRSERSGAG